MPRTEHFAPIAARSDPATTLDMDAALFAALELSLSSWVVVASAPGQDKAGKHAVAACDALRCHSTCFTGRTLGSSAPACLHCCGACGSVPSGAAVAQWRWL